MLGEKKTKKFSEHKNYVGTQRSNQLTYKLFAESSLQQGLREAAFAKHSDF